ncbi:hypothetical protein B4O97_04160 [Marispirochaeta aestuarii]|uniref:Uncharacterized protein n=1 Tax=Marispirochaeta aestuarii TaxID=1963862 RepID=A0A1Y1S1L4_9SPIO|nr:hypothetical protein [Marispirochaeta aestuarii]ORC37392.1 hypothetical protein B4O97_04160 [Marispirochaeta aestuarii]
MKRGSDAMHYSLAEFAYILFFLSVWAALLVYGRYQAVAVQYQNAREEISLLTEEVNYLNEVLAEKENAVVPCWRRPDKAIPEVAGVIAIHSSTIYTLTRNPGDDRDAFAAPPETRDTILKTRTAAFFKEELAYAREKNCYIRVRIENHTNDFSLYKGMAQVLAGLGIVVVNE